MLRIRWPGSSVPHHIAVHWLPATQRIIYKVATLTFKTRLHHQPTYLYDLLHNYTPTRPLRSSAANLLSKPTTTTKTSDRAFTVAAAQTWNNLSTTLFDLQHHFIFSLTISKRTSSQLPSNSHQSSPEPMTHDYCDELYGAVRKFFIDWLIDWVQYGGCIQLKMEV